MEDDANAAHVAMVSVKLPLFWQLILSYGSHKLKHSLLHGKLQLKRHELTMLSLPYCWNLQPKFFLHLPAENLCTVLNEQLIK